MGKHNKGASTNFYHIVTDCIFCIISLIMAAFISNAGFDVIDKEYWKITLAFMIIYVLLEKDARIYNITTFFYPDRFLKRVTRSFALSALITSSLTYLDNEFIIDVKFFILFLVISYAVLLFNAFFVHFILKKLLWNTQRTVLIGPRAEYDKFLHFIGKSNISINLIGYISLDRNADEGYLGYIGDLEAIIHDNAIDQIYVMTKQYGDTIEVQPFINLCIEMGITVRIVTNTYDGGTAQSYVSSVGTYPVITYHTISLNKSHRAIKRAIDILGALAGLILFSAVMLITALLIKLESKGPIIFKQKRIGMNGRCFNMYKFRSMCEDAEGKKQALMEQNEMQGNFMFKIKEDPRITKVGKFIRKTSIDELPQFINVLLGDMSLVGTRPPTLDEVEQYKTNHWRRMSFRPGITGMWQISGRSSITNFDEIVKLDTAYIDSWSIWLDFKILILTLFQLVKRRGAF